MTQYPRLDLTKLKDSCFVSKYSYNTNTRKREHPVDIDTKTKKLKIDLSHIPRRDKNPTLKRSPVVITPSCMVPIATYVIEFSRLVAFEGC